VGIANMAVMRPELIMKSIIPVVMAGIIAIYGLVVSVLIANGMKAETYSLFKGFIDLGAGLSVGISGLAAGYAIGVVGDAGVRGTGQQEKVSFDDPLCVVMKYLRNSRPPAFRLSN
jgi:V-type H+-transporting ATPase proteolipid subunit